MKNSLLLLISFFSALSSFAFDDNPDDILGTWANSSNKAHIQIFKQDGKFYGKVVWLKNPTDANGVPKVDKKNPDAKERSNHIIGLVVLKDFKYDNKEWKNGKIYNPEDGKEYHSFIKFQDNRHLSVRGYVGFSLFGKTEKFTRVR